MFSSDEKAEWRRKVMAGQQAMKERCMAAALKYTPSSVVVMHIRNSLSGNAGAWAPVMSINGMREHLGSFQMTVPRPVTRKSLYIFLHECAHVHLGHVALRFYEGMSYGHPCTKYTKVCKKTRHVQEMEAEKQAHEWMRAEGIPVPKKMTARAKSYVSRKISQAEARGCKKVDRAARKFAEGY